jgi:hypothetical protein
MSKVTIALGSFVVGACCMFLILSGKNTSTLAQERAPLISAPDAIPSVPMMELIHLGGTISGAVQQIDGMDCTNCVLVGSTLRYGGGAFNFSNAKFSGVTRVELSGAAANTALFLNIVQQLGLGKPPQPTPPAQPNTPITRMADVKQPITFSFASPYGLK